MASKYYKNTVKSRVKTAQTVFIFILVIMLVLVGTYQGIKFLAVTKKAHEYETRTSEYLKDKGYHYDKLVYIEQMMNIECSYDKTHKLQVLNLVSPKGKHIGDLVLYYVGPEFEWGGYVENLPTEDIDENRP